MSAGASPVSPFQLAYSQSHRSERIAIALAVIALVAGVCFMAISQGTISGSIAAKIEVVEAARMSMAFLVVGGLLGGTGIVLGGVLGGVVVCRYHSPASRIQRKLDQHE